MVGEAFAGISAFKTIFDIAKALKGMDDTVKRNAAVSDLWEQITSVQARYTAALERVHDLEKELARFETWEREKQRYERKNVGFGAFAYVLKESERGAETPHWVCTNCFESGKIKTLQYGRFEKGTGAYWRCPDCKNDIDPGVANAKWPANDPEKRTT